MIPQKRVYGKGRIAHFSPPTLQTGAKMVNCYVNFVELLQGFQQRRFVAFAQLAAIGQRVGFAHHIKDCR